jgi:AcrR family transcriptional regulator/site-specific recombinase XerD
MSNSSLSTHQRLIQSALDLFLSQGIDNTTTRQIANLAQVNEVTLFRNFGNKYGLLQAVIEESPAFATLGENLMQPLHLTGDVAQILKVYAARCLQLLEQKPDLLRSLIGEGEQYSDAARQALAQKLSEAHGVISQSLMPFLRVHYSDGPYPDGSLPPEKWMPLLNGLLLSYAILSFTCQSPVFWRSRDEFLDEAIQFCIHGLAHESIPTDLSTNQSNPSVQASSPTETSSLRSSFLNIFELPATLVHAILQRAQKLGLQDYALAYVLFGAGLTPAEIASLQRSQQISTPQQHVLQVPSPMGIRPVPINQWILGKRYGSYTSNPLTKWIRSRKDQHPALFLEKDGQGITEGTIHQSWRHWTEELTTPEGKVPTVAQAQQTWIIEMLMRGMSLENLSILTGLDTLHLQPYAHRAKEKIALEQATVLDQKNRGNSGAKR